MGFAIIVFAIGFAVGFALAIICYSFAYNLAMVKYVAIISLSMASHSTTHHSHRLTSLLMDALLLLMVR